MVPSPMDWSRAAFRAIATLAVLGLSFAVGLYSGATHNRLFVAVADTKASIEDAFETVIGEAPTLAGVPIHFLQPSRYARDGVTVDEVRDDGALILLSGFFDESNELRLIRRDGTVEARWPVAYSTLFPDPSHLPENSVPATDWNIDTHGALALEDGSVVFNFEYGGLVKLDRCGGVVWTLPRRTHHSVARAEGGGFWVPSRRLVHDGPSPYPPFEEPYQEDTILRVSDDGHVLSEHSALGVFYDNGLEAIATASGSRFTSSMIWDEEVVHLNKIAELPRRIAPDFPLFEAGDLVLSYRDFNLLMVVAPDTWTVKWWEIGPWRRQHDPEFRPGGTILLFNNNVYNTAFGDSTDQTPVTAPRVSNVGEVDPVTRTYRVLFGGTKGQELLSVIRGKVDATSTGGLVITEFEGGRVLETGAGGNVLWEFVNHYDADTVAEITEAHVYPAGYFDVTDWSCQGSQR